MKNNLSDGVCVPLQVAERIGVYLSVKRKQRARNLAAWRRVSLAFRDTIPPQMPTTSDAVLRAVLKHRLCDEDLRRFLTEDSELYCCHTAHSQTAVCPAKQRKRACASWNALYRSRYPAWELEDVKLDMRRKQMTPRRLQKRA